MNLIHQLLNGENKMNNFNTKQNMLSKKHKTIKKELLINGGDLDLYLDLFITDKDGKTEKVVSKKADSILANFIRILYVLMGRDVRSGVLGGTFYYLGHTFSSSNIVSITAGDSSKYRITGTSSLFSSYPSSGKITLGGFQGINLAGRFNFTKISNSIIDIDGTTYSAGWVTGTGGGAAYFPTTSLGNPSEYSFRSDGIIVGSGDTPVTIDDYMLDQQIPNGSSTGSLTYGSLVVSQDTNDSTSAQITITQTFINNTTSTIEIKEIGLLQYGSSSSGSLLTMRDILPSPVNIGSGSTLTVNYRLKTVLDTGTDPGGFLASFMRLMYRKMALTTRAIFDIDNVSRTHAPSQADFCVIHGGGLNVENPNQGEYLPAYKFGIILGTGNTAVSMGDYSLNSLIEHGETSGKMLHYGGFVEGFLIGPDYAEFNVIKAFENNSGAAIVVREYGLVVATDNYSALSSASNKFIHLFAITRNVLTTPKTVADQEILKVIYTIRCVVPGSSS